MGIPPLGTWLLGQGWREVGELGRLGRAVTSETGECGVVVLGPLISEDAPRGGRSGRLGTLLSSGAVGRGWHGCL